MNKHNTPSNADWCSHGKGWTVDCAECGRRASRDIISNHAVRVRLEMLEHAVFTKYSPGSPPAQAPQGTTLAPGSTPENSSLESRPHARSGEPGDIIISGLPPITRQRLTQLSEMLDRDLREYPVGQHSSVHYASRAEIAELVRGYLELVDLAESIEKRLGGVRT